jgi:phosphopantetheinyl transferase
MPIFFQQDIDEDTKLGIWKIEEQEEFFLQKVIPQRNVSHPHKKLQHLAGRYLLKYLFPEFPVELIRIADTRKPFLEDEAFHFSISHCSDYAAAIVSRKSRVGVDAEVISQKIERIGKKFVSDGERKIFAGKWKDSSKEVVSCHTFQQAESLTEQSYPDLSQEFPSGRDRTSTAVISDRVGHTSSADGTDSTWLTLVWSCKEAVFKWYGWGGVDFKEHMQIIEMTMNQANMYNSIMQFRKNEELFLPLHSVLFGNLCLSYVVT